MSGVAKRLRRKALALRDRVEGALGRLQTVHFLHLGKTGGTAVKHALAPHVSLPRSRLVLHPHQTRLRQVPEGEGVVFFVRDPVRRFVSGFYSRQRQGQPRYLSPWSTDEAQAFEAFSSPAALARALGSSNADERARASHAMRSIEHVRDSYWSWFEDETYFNARLGDIRFIGFQESLDADFERLKLLLGAPADLRLPSGEVEAHRNRADVDRTLSDHEAAQLEQWYAKDYAFLALCRRVARDLETTGRA